VTFTATVAAVAASGLVQFYSDGATLGSAVSLVSGTANERGEKSLSAFNVTAQIPRSASLAELGMTVNGNLKAPKRPPVRSISADSANPGILFTGFVP